jgi:hypothetical protein
MKDSRLAPRRLKPSGKESLIAALKALRHPKSGLSSNVELRYSVAFSFPLTAPFSRFTASNSMFSPMAFHFDLGASTLESSG